jgi:O-acetyl-ADP-ribose deacetylase (regulator of RNase III)
MAIQVKQGDITKIKCDAVVNPANSQGFMGGGAAGALKRAGGDIIEQQAVQQAPIPVGTAIATSAGNLPCKYVIHAPTMEQPAMRIIVDNVEKATRAALKLARDLGIQSIAIPGMGTGVGGVSEADAAKVMIKAVEEFEHDFIDIILLDRNQTMINAFTKFL